MRATLRRGWRSSWQGPERYRPKSFARRWRKQPGVRTSMRAGEIVIQARLHPSGNWVTLPVNVAGAVELYMVLDTGSPVSVINPAIRDELITRQLMSESTDRTHYCLTRLEARQQTLPDMTVRVLPRLLRLQVDGLLG